MKLFKISSIYLLCISIFLIQNYVSNAQINEGGIPKSFINTTITDVSKISTISMPSFDVSAMLKEDSINSGNAFSYRFAKSFDVNYSINKSGTLDLLDNGDKIWRLKIKSPGAYSLNIIFSEFHIPDSAKVYLYNIDNKFVIGAFTSKNNSENNILATMPVKGDEIIVEYFEPKNVNVNGKLTIGRISHDYKNIFACFDQPGGGSCYGNSLSCEVDINCSAGSNWQNEKHAVCRIFINGNSLCSGSLLNNTAQDGTPYFLTANHCICSNSDANSVVAVFNYESPYCIGGDGPINQTVSNSTLLASSGLTDFALIKLSSIPNNYSPYYLGWDMSGQNPPVPAVCIHHPGGDVKKISISNYSLNTISYNLGSNCTNENKDCWLLHNWTTGDIEHGSSGAPLIDNNHRVIGQVYGDENGTIACPGTYLNNLFGRFSTSWTGGGSLGNRLLDYLDPLKTGTNTLNGAPYITGPTYVCLSGATFTANNLPSGFTFTWSYSSNLTLSSQSGNTAVFYANGTSNGTGWVQVTVNGYNNSGTVSSLQYPINWVGGSPSKSNIFFKQDGYACDFVAYSGNTFGVINNLWSMDGSNWESDPVTETYGSFMPNSTVTVYLKQQNQCGTSPESSIKQKMPTTPKGCMEIVTNQVSSLELNENLDTLSGKSKTSGSLNNNTELNKIAVLFQNTPNPFNQITTIGYFLPSNVESASINIYNIQCLKVKSYPIQDRGNGIITIKTGDLSTAGIYLYTLITDGIVIDTKRLILTD